MRMRRQDFDAAVAVHGRKVYTLAVYLLANREEAEDVTQEVLVRLWRRGHEVVPEKIGPWLVRVTRNACIDAIRRRRDGTQVAIEGEAGIELREPAPGPDRLAHASQLGGRILLALDTLTEPSRSVVILREIQGLSYQEIGEALEMPMSSVRVTLHRGRRRLREELKEVHDHVAAS
ncbi:MAG: RNA polymerase sigma factor [Thermoanaerobaculales bacterium]|nr:RNA polymerase sigma factor [Thermoanaerobaculales bacterium]